MKETTAILFTLIPLIMCSCGEKEPNNWTHADRQEFLSECNVDGKMHSYCKCVLNDVEKAFPDVHEIDRNYAKVEKHILTVSVGKCLDTVYDLNIDKDVDLNNIYDETKSEYDLFMDECNIGGTMHDYCNCTYGKYLKYGLDYYMKNIDQVTQECIDYLY